ncbi:MAG: transposase [Gemmatimonadetes bacterium]|nr:transposase [Gemmatimonadota bacterium]MYA10398.1 transposase [Gemmatimonadota bacterium]MYD12514.1 transposase [Gemmatimonadota bacterium]MYE69178.1 transposase [Gemmatimonadota bacterium]MYI67115.1 transposase [Gemmatimonadota bacterium]
MQWTRELRNRPREAGRCVSARCRCPNEVLALGLDTHITCGGRPLFAQLRPGNSDPAGGVTAPLGRIIERLRQEWPWLKILLRADSAYAREELLAWCEDNGVDYVIGLAKNSRLIEKIGWELADAEGRVSPSRPARTPVRRVPLRHPDELVATATGRRQGRTPAGQGQPPLRRHLAARRHLLGPHGLRARLLPAGRHGEHHQGAAARSVLRPDLGLTLRRQPAPAPLRVGPLRRPQTHARGRPHHGLGAKGQGRHGLLASLRRRLRPPPRPIRG